MKSYFSDCSTKGSSPNIYEGRDDEGWPHYKQTQGVDAEEMITQELLLRSCIIEYFGV